MSILIEKLNITIDNVNYDSQYIYSNIRLSQELMKPNELRFHMTKSILAEDESDLKVDISSSLLGKDIQFSMTTFRDDESKSGNSDVLKFSGIVFGVKALRKQMGSELILEITAHSHDYLLQDSADCNSYENTTLSAVVSDVTSEYGNIPLSVKPVMKEDIPYVVQYNETSYEFLARLAQRYGEWFYNTGSQLIFGELEKKEIIDLVPGFDIMNYEYEIGMKHSKITHARHNYLDYQNTQATSSESGALHRLAGFASGASDALYQKTTFRNYHSSLAEENSLDEVEHSTKAQAMGKQAGTMSCRGSSNRCDLQIGSLIRIKEYFDPGTGEEQEYTHEELLISGITHYAENDGSYQNEFTAIDPAAEHPPYAFGDCYPQTETQRAMVKDNKDPEHLGRVRVQFLWQQEQDDSQMTPWIRIAQPHGGGDKGFYFIPEVDEEVVVGFENGNAEKPYVIGTLYHGQAKPSDTWYNDEDNIKAIRTRSGHTMEFHDTMGNEYIRIYDNEKDNFVLTFSTVEKLIKLQSKGNIELYADKDIIIDAKENIRVSAGIDISEKAGSNNIIEIGKDRTIAVGNNISEKAGDNNTIEIGKDRTITVGNNISEKAGDNNTIEIGKDRTIEVGNNISESAGADISLDAKSNISENAGGNIKERAGGSIEIGADKNISESAGGNMSMEAGKNMILNAEENMNESAGKDFRLSASKNAVFSIDKDMNMSVGENMDNKIGKNMYANISDKFDLRADNVEQVSNKKMRMIANKIEQKADSAMEINGGSKIDIKSSNSSFN
ncbi:MAG: type VI secretion system Vgr family protein [Dysgonomonas sp.]